ncbi:MAG: TolC family protein [Candidatus Aminicenantes bacterium]|nr:TolC family protein [Candidatus Aminicenantes bacterium]
MFFLIALLCFNSVNFQAAGQKQFVYISLEQAVEIAWQRNPALQSLAQEINYAVAQTMIDTSLQESEIGIEVEGLRVFNTNTIEKEYSFGLSQYLPFPGKLNLKNRIGATNQQEARLKLEQEKIRLATEVKKAYFLCLLNQKTVETWEKNLKLLHDVQESAISLYALGKVSYEDVLRIKIEIARNRNELFQARRDLNTSQLELQRLLGLKHEAEIKLTSPLVYQPLAATPDELIEKARLSSPTLKLAAQQRERADLLVQLAEKNKLPDFVLGLYAPSHRFGAVGFSVGISYPLFSRKKISGEKMLAEAERQKARYKYESVARFFETRKKQALENILVAEQQIKIFTDQLLGETENLLTKARADFQLGRMDSLNLLDIFRQARLVNLEYYRAIYLYLTSLAEFETAGEEYS